MGGFTQKLLHSFASISPKAPSRNAMLGGWPFREHQLLVAASPLRSENSGLEVSSCLDAANGLDQHFPLLRPASRERTGPCCATISTMR
jgi:hypothetical protein